MHGCRIEREGSKFSELQGKDWKSVEGDNFICDKREVDIAPGERLGRDQSRMNGYIIGLSLMHNDERSHFGAEEPGPQNEDRLLSYQAVHLIIADVSRRSPSSIDHTAPSSQNGVPPRSSVHSSATEFRQEIPPGAMSNRVWNSQRNDFSIMNVQYYLSIDRISPTQMSSLSDFDGTFVWRKTVLVSECLAHRCEPPRELRSLGISIFQKILILSSYPGPNSPLAFCGSNATTTEEQGN